MVKPDFGGLHLVLSASVDQQSRDLSQAEKKNTVVSLFKNNIKSKKLYNFINSNHTESVNLVGQWSRETQRVFGSSLYISFIPAFGF